METIHTRVERYVAEGIEGTIITQAPIMDGLFYNICEAVGLHSEDE